MPAQTNEPPKLDHIAPSWFQEVWEDLRDYLIKSRPVAGLNIAITDADGGGLLINAQATRRGQISNKTPWQVDVRNFGDADAPDWRFIVNKASRLLDSSDPEDEVTVNGKASDYTPDNDDTGWHPFGLSTDGIKVWIKTSFNTDPESWGEVSGDSVIEWTGNADWAGGEAEYENVGDGDGPDYLQVFNRKLIAIIYDQTGEGKVPTIDQWVDTHLELKYTGGEANDSGGGTPKQTALRLAQAP